MYCKKKCSNSSNSSNSSKNDKHLKKFKKSSCLSPPTDNNSPLLFLLFYEVIFLLNFYLPLIYTTNMFRVKERT